MFNFFRDLYELISIFLTAPTTILGLVVLIIWGKEAITSFKKSAACRLPMDWLIIGVVASFLGAVVDNFYWSFGWAHHFVTNGFSDTISNIGIGVNILFRQLCGSFAAYCHIKSYTEMKDNKSLNKKVFIISFVIGTAYVALLSYLR